MLAGAVLSTASKCFLERIIFLHDRDNVLTFRFSSLEIQRFNNRRRLRLYKKRLEAVCKTAPAIK